MKINTTSRGGWAVLAASLLLSACNDDDNNTTATVTVPSPSSVAQSSSQAVTTPINTPIDITLSGGSGSSVRFTVAAQPNSGVLTGQLSGSSLQMTYTPDIDFFGSDVITFEVTDSNGSATGEISVNVLDSVLPTADSDGDGLLDLDELNNYRTNPYLSDTDGDGFSDFDEVTTYSFNADINNFRFNPLIADTPQIDVRIVSAPDILINYTLTDGTTKTIGTSRSNTSSQAVSTSESQSESTAISESHTASVEVSTSITVSVEAGLASPPKAKVEKSASVTAGYSYENTTTNEQTTSWSREQTQENSATREQNESFARQNSEASSEGEINVSVAIQNTGHISYTLNNLFLSASYWRPRDANPLVPVGNLSFDASQGNFPAVTLSPGQSTGTLTFKASNVNLQKITEILDNSKGLTIRPTLYNMLDQDGRAYNFAATGSISNDAMVIVDYNGNQGNENINKMVAVNGVPNQTINLADALNRVLKINATTTTDDDGNRYINSVNGIANSEEKNGLWLLLHARQSGNGEVVTTIYTTPEDEARWTARNPNVSNLVSSYDPSNISLSGGDVVHVVYLQDEDQDGLSNRMEYFYRTDPKDADTDNDGLADGVEVNDGWSIAYRDMFQADVYTQVYYDPALADTDNDQVSDYAEANFDGTSGIAEESARWLRRNPNRADTDGDGLDDSIDDREYLNPGFGALLSNGYDDLRVSDLTPTVDLNNAGTPLANGQVPYDVAVDYALPTILQLPNPAAEGLVDYQVVTLRYIDESGSGEFPELTKPLQDGRPYIVGDKIPCQVPAWWPQGSVCNWEVVDVAQPTTPLASTQQSFIDFSQIRSEVKSGNTVTTSADVFKYTQFVNVNGYYTRQRVEKVSSPQTEVVEIHMHKGDFTNVRTLFGQNANQAGGVTVTKLISWANSGRLTRWVTDQVRSNDRYAIYAYDAASGSRVGWYDMPNLSGDGTLDISWRLKINGEQLNRSAPKPYLIGGSGQVNYDAGTRNLPDALTYTWDGNPAYEPGTLDHRMKLFYWDYDATQNLDVAVPVDPASGGAIYKLVVPAVTGCHTIELEITEWDTRRNHATAVAHPLTP